MKSSARSHLTAVVAALGVSAATLAPMPLDSARTGHPQTPAVRSLGVSLAAAVDPITPWVNTLTNTWDGVTGLAGLYLRQPFPLATTIVRNQLTYLQELPDVGLIAHQIAANVGKFFTAPYEPVPELVSDALVTTIGGLPVSQQTVYALLPMVLGDAYGPLKPLIDAATTPVSSELIGAIGPLISPLIQLTRSFTAIGENFQQGKVVEALNEFLNIPANVTNAMLNGGTFLNLTSVVEALGVSLPPQVTSIGLNMGGLVSAVPRAYQPPTVPSSAHSGGVAFDALAGSFGLKFSGDPGLEGVYLPVDDPGWPVGPVGSVIGLGQALGKALLVDNPIDAELPPAAPAQAIPAEASDSAPLEAATPADVADVPAPRRGRHAPGDSDGGSTTRAAARGLSRH